MPVKLRREIGPIEPTQAGAGLMYPPDTTPIFSVSVKLETKSRALEDASDQATSLLARLERVRRPCPYSFQLVKSCGALAPPAMSRERSEYPRCALF